MGHEVMTGDSRSTEPGGPDGWALTPEGAAIHLGEGVAVVADVHLGYEWARGAGGDMVPPHSLAETIGKLGRILARGGIGRLIVAGDLVESHHPCRRTERDVRALEAWLRERDVALEVVQGNHDPVKRPPRPWTVEVGGWTVGHGHRPILGERIVFGHHHPALRAGGLTAPCFLVGPRLIVLPAFSANAAGLPASAVPLPRGFESEAIRCLAGVGDQVLDFGPLTTLDARLARVGDPSVSRRPAT